MYLKLPNSYSPFFSLRNQTGIEKNERIQKQAREHTKRQFNKRSLKAKNTKGGPNPK